MLVTAAGSVRLLREEHRLNAYFPMLVTVSGSVMEVTAQLEKAYSSMPVTVYVSPS